MYAAALTYRLFRTGLRNQSAHHAVCWSVSASNCSFTAHETVIMWGATWKTAEVDIFLSKTQSHFRYSYIWDRGKCPRMFQPVLQSLHEDIQCWCIFNSYLVRSGRSCRIQWGERVGFCAQTSQQAGGRTGAPANELRRHLNTSQPRQMDTDGENAGLLLSKKQTITIGNGTEWSL